MKKALFLIAACTVSTCTLAKLPPLSDEAKAKAAETAAKTAHAAKVDSFQLCKAQDRVVAHYRKTDTKGSKAAPSTCVDPGPFVWTPVAPAAPAAAAQVPATAPAATAKKS